MLHFLLLIFPTTASNNISVRCFIRSLISGKKKKKKGIPPAPQTGCLIFILTFASLPYLVSSAFLQDWLPCFLENMSSSFLVYSLVLVQYFLQDISLGWKAGSTVVDRVMTALESCCSNLDGCPLYLKHNYYSGCSLYVSPVLNILFSILHIF